MAEMYTTLNFYDTNKKMVIKNQTSFQAGNPVQPRLQSGTPPS